MGEAQEDTEGCARTGLPVSIDRGPPPAGVRLETRDFVGELLVADSDFEVGDLVLREKFLMLGPTELPPLDMFSPVPAEVANVEMKGEGFPGVTSWDHLHLKLLFEFTNADDDVQAEALRMQDAMSPGETRQSIEQVARWLSEQNRPWLGEFTFEDIFRLLRLFCVNSYPCRSAGSTSGLLKWGTMINHSCRPNVTFHSLQVGRDFEGRYRAVRPIRKGDVLGSSYMKPAVGLASLVQRRRVLWCLKGFSCCCERCSYEAVHGDEARSTSCKECAGNCSMAWQFHPPVGAFAFVGQNCGAVADAAATLKESQISAEVIHAFFRHWQSFEEATASTTALQERTRELPEDHFARRGLEALLLSLEGEFLAGARQRPQLSAAKAKDWFLRVSALRDWLQLFRREPNSSLLLMLSFGGLAPSIRDLSPIASPESDPEWLQEIEAWAKTMLALDAASEGVESEDC